ncbi:MAG TPA: hypothetical protein VGN64_08160 [Dyadobacter sp.]|jgi:hypothetical protein|nr:hypothetical protein [Dyadobacter sp.]
MLFTSHRKLTWKYGSETEISVPEIQKNHLPSEITPGSMMGYSPALFYNGHPSQSPKATNYGE